MLANSVSNYHTSPILPDQNHVSQAKRLEELLNCNICYDKVRQATMCPYCSKLYCEPCIRRSLQVKSECPNCRRSVKSLPMTQCSKFINQLNVLLAQLIEQKNSQQKCSQHGVLINYYCNKCLVPVCCECEMFGRHKGHGVEQLNKVYDSRIEKVKQLLAILKKDAKNKELSIKDVQNKTAELKKQKQRLQLEVEENTQYYRLKILNDTNTQQKYLDDYYQLVNVQLRRIEDLEKSLVKRLGSATRLTEPAPQEDEVVKEICAKRFTVPDTISKLDFINELIPPYFEGAHTIQEFSRKRRERTIQYSAGEEDEGLEWRLKIYPNGNESVEGTHLSVFLELVSSVRAESVYEYQIELVNAKAPENRMVRQYSSLFEAGECWGYNKYIRLQNLVSEGFVDEATDSVKIKYFVRHPSYYDLSTHKAAYIDQLDAEANRQNQEILRLEGQLRLQQQQPQQQPQ